MVKETILIIEDEPTINRIIGGYFKKEKYTVLSALNGETGLELFQKNKVDLICLDIMMPKVDGWLVAKKIRETSNVPIIMMSALSEEEDILKGYSLKINDYITKPFTPKILVAKIKNLLESIQNTKTDAVLSDILNIEGLNIDVKSFRDNRKLRDLLTNDELTGIANRRYIDFYLNNLKDRSKEFNSSFGILFMDIDYFKKVNDQYGHNTGDEILKYVTMQIKDNLRSADLLGRWGGEEFIAVLQLRNDAELRIIAEKLRLAVEEAVFKYNRDISIGVTISIGGSMYRNDEIITELINRADKNMYEAKNKGRNQCLVE